MKYFNSRAFLKIFFSSFAVLFFQLEALAQNLPTATQLALANSAALHPNNINGALLNPAALSLQAELSIGGLYSLGDNSPLDSSYSFWVKDSVFSSFPTKKNAKVRQQLSQDGALPLAAAFVFQNQKNTGQSDRLPSYALYLSQLLSSKLSLGVKLNYFDYQKIDNRMHLDLGLLYFISPHFCLGLHGTNLTQDLLPQGSKEQQNTLSFYGRVLPEVQIFASLDSFFKGTKKSKPNLSLGTEIAFKEFFALRAGLKYQSVEKTVDFSWGLGFIGPRLQINYGYSYDAINGSPLHSVDFALPLW